MDACDLADLAAAYLHPLHDWQKDVAACWLADDGNGHHATKTGVLVVPRQNGKTQLLAARILWGLLFANGGEGEQIHYSAHRVDTTLEMFETLVNVFGDPRANPSEWRFSDLHELIEGITFTNGRQRIKLKTGADVRFTARSTGAGRGVSVDLQLFDEAGFLTDDQLSALLPTQSAAPHKDPQAIYAGTPPSELGITAEPFARVRSNAIDGKAGYSLNEWSTEKAPNIITEDVVKACNPSLGLTLLPDVIQNELGSMSAEKFAIERLGWWPERATSKAVDAFEWDNAATDGGYSDDEIAKMCIGVKFAPGGEHVCASVAVLLKDKRAHVELVHDATTLNGIGWLVDWCKDGAGKVAGFIIDGKGGAGDLAQRLLNSGVSRKAVIQLRTADVVTAATGLTALLREGNLTHYPSEQLDASARSATRRKVGDGYGFGGDSCALESAAAAVWGLSNVKRNPLRKMKVL